MSVKVKIISPITFMVTFINEDSEHDIFYSSLENALEAVKEFLENV